MYIDAFLARLLIIAMIPYFYKYFYKIELQKTQGLMVNIFISDFPAQNLANISFG